MDENLDVNFVGQHIITVLEQHIQLQHNDFSSAEAKAQSHIATTAVVISISGGFSLLGSNISSFGYWMLFFAFISFIWVMFWSLRALVGQKMQKVLDGSEKKFEELLVFLKYPKTYEVEIRKMYKGIIEHNEQVVSNKLKWANKAIWGVSTQLFFTLLLVISPHIQWLWSELMRLFGL